MSKLNLLDFTANVWRFRVVFLPSIAFYRLLADLYLYINPRQVVIRPWRPEGDYSSVDLLSSSLKRDRFCDPKFSIRSGLVFQPASHSKSARFSDDAPKHAWSLLFHVFSPSDAIGSIRSNHLYNQSVPQARAYAYRHRSCLLFSICLKWVASNRLSPSYSALCICVRAVGHVRDTCHSMLWKIINHQFTSPLELVMV